MIQIITDAAQLQTLFDLAVEKALFRIIDKMPMDGRPSIIPLKRAAEIAGKTPNALRVQICLGNLKSIKKQGKHFFDAKAFESWLRGDLEPETFKEDPTVILKN